jgi:kinetochore protein Spc7/SPC105
VFKKSKKNSNDSTNSTTSPLSSSPADVVVTDENAYPGRRRSSVRKSVAYSEGEASMEVDDDDEDAVGPSAFMFAEGDSALADDDQEEEYDDDGEDMEMTEAISQNIIRKRSLSLNPQPRRPLSNVPHKPLSSPTNTNPSSEPDHSYTDDNSTSTSISTTDDHPLEYTVPLVKPPAPPSDAWLKLRSVTHSGDTPYQAPLSDDDGGEGGEEAMELTDAVQRLLVARRSLGAVQQEDSFASTNDSLLDDDDDEEEGGDHTVNVTALARRASMVTTASEAGDSTMEVTGDYGAGIIDQAGRLSVGPVHPQPPPPPSASKPSIFTPLSPSKLNKPPGQHATVPQPFTFTLPPKSQPQASPSKIPFPVFSAAPTASRTSPKKRSAPVDENQNVNGGIEPEDRPSPAKKLAVAGRWPDTSTPRAATSTPKPPASASKTPSRLSPSKKAPFLAQQQQQQTLTDTKKPVGSVRRPSGYFAQRKSLVPPPNADDDVGQKKSPAKKAGSGNGNASTIRFDVATEKEIAQRDEEARARSRSPARVLSPAPKASRAASPTNEIDQDEDAVMQIVNPAAQWREDVQEQSFSSEEDGPHISIEQFFNMTGIRFMDEITAPRRSTIHPSALRPRRHSSPSSTFPADSDIPLAEYVTAMSVDVPQLELYTYVSKDLEAWIERSKGIFLEAEAEAEKITPELFREFVAAGEDGQAELLHQLKLIKANTHGNAKSEWYDWKLQWVGQLFGKAEKGFTDLTEVCFVRSALDI